MAEPDSYLARPEHPCGTGVLVLSGSSGRVERDRCQVLAGAGAVAMSIQWFGGPGQPPGICEVPLETFAPALQRLRADCDRVAVLGTSKGAEAALLLGALVGGLDAVVAIAPTAWVWANVGPGLDGHLRPQRSSWSLGGIPLPFLPYDDDWQWPGPGLPEYREHYALCEQRFAADRPQARIRVERIEAELLLVAGGDDRMWGSVEAAQQIQQRRAQVDKATTVVTLARAGHRVTLPGEQPLAPSRLHAHGGTPSDDQALGARAWPHLIRALGLTVD